MPRSRPSSGRLRVEPDRLRQPHPQRRFRFRRAGRRSKHRARRRHRRMHGRFVVLGQRCRLGGRLDQGRPERDLVAFADRSLQQSAYTSPRWR